jgi:hypothetical protein
MTMVQCGFLRPCPLLFALFAIPHSHAIEEVLLNQDSKSSVFWETTSCNPLKAKRRFGVTCRLLLQRRSQETSVKTIGMQPSACHLLSRWFLDLFLDS